MERYYILFWPCLLAVVGLYFTFTTEEQRDGVAKALIQALAAILVVGWIAEQFM